ncbi:hypothetical protein FB451DRAFT_1573177 [Mycena latifolia]|nr:hypothetical protein FB451DRAFT_1573177 [Mycena latifolia]
MAKTRTAAQTNGTNAESSTAASAAPPPNRLALVHIEELSVIWPADPRIPSVESRRAWAIARNIIPGKVHDWFSHRRRTAKKLRLKIPAETYELPVGTPPVIPVVVKDEPVEPDVPPTTAQPSKSLKRKRNVKIEPSSDTIPEPTKQPRTKKRKAAAEPSSGNATAENDAPAVRTKKAKNQVDIEPVVEEAAPTTKSLKRTRNTENDTTSDAAEPAPAEKQPKKKRKKIDNESLADTATAEPEAPAPAKSVKKKKKKIDIEPTVEHKALPPPQTTKRQVRFSSPIDDAPPSSSPTLFASSPPGSDAPTVFDDDPTSSQPSKSSENSAYIHPPVELDVTKPPRSAPASSTAKPKNSNASTKSAPKKSSAQKPSVLKKSTAPTTSSASEDSIPLNKPSASKKTSAAKKSAPPKKRKAKATPAPAPEFEPEPEPVCDHGDKTQSTGFTCALCAAPTPEDFGAAADDNEIRADFNYVFGFPTEPMHGPVDGFVVDVTSLSALPFLADPSAFLAAGLPPADSRDDDSGFAYDDEGGYVLDGEKFTCDGVHVGDGPGPFFPVPTVDWSDRMRAMGLGDDGMPLENWEGGEGGLEDPESAFGLRLPAFSFPDPDSDSESHD